MLTSDANGLATWQVASGSGGGGSTCVGTENICYGTDYVGSPSGSSNTSMGVASLNFLTSGNFNSAYGRGSLYNNTS